MNAIHALYQLSYTPITLRFPGAQTLCVKF